MNLFGIRRDRVFTRRENKKELSRIFEKGYLIVCEFCEFEGAKSIYTLPNLDQEALLSRPGQSTDDVCIKKRLSRQFLSSDHCTESSEGELSLSREAQFYQEVEIGGKNDVLEADKNKPLMLFCLGTQYKV